MIFQSPGSIFLTVGTVSVYYYGICLAFGILLGAFVMLKMAKKYYPQFNTDELYDCIPYMVIFGIIFARLYYVCLSWEYFSNHLNEIIMIRNGGIAIHGAILGGAIFLLAKTKFNKEKFLSYCDVFTWGLIAGQIVGRWGDFFNSEAFGTPTDLWWKLYIAPQYRPAGMEQFEFFHPTFLYESLWNCLIFIVLFILFRKYLKNINGGVFLSYLILYSIGRILVESIRTDTVSFIYGIPFPIFLSVIIITIASILLFYQAKRI